VSQSKTWQYLTISSYDVRGVLKNDQCGPSISLLLLQYDGAMSQDTLVRMAMNILARVSLDIATRRIGEEAI
jgi:hypothetical protein